jgi:hypothetical protein
MKTGICTRIGQAAAQGVDLLLLVQLHHRLVEAFLVVAVAVLQAFSRGASLRMFAMDL